MKNRNELSEAERFALDYYQRLKDIDEAAHYRKLYAIGKKIHDSLQPEPWEPRGGGWFLEFGGSVVSGETSNVTRLVGSEGKTKEEVQRIADLRIEREIINAWIREENERTEWAADWKNDTQLKYTMKYDHSSNLWTHTTGFTYEAVGEEVCSNESAKKLIDLLNKGLIKGVNR